MIIIFGQVGSGKSLQGQILAVRNNWKWLSTGQLLRDRNDPAITAHINGGNLADSAFVESILQEAIDGAQNPKQIVLDGFPRTMDQVEWLLKAEAEDNKKVDLVISLDVARDVLEKRVFGRKRQDDTLEVVNKRFEIYDKQTSQILDFFSSHNVKVVHVDGSGAVGQIHDQIMKELEACKLV